MANISETLIPIPGRLHDVSTDGVVSGANEIYDDTLGKRQSELNGGILVEKDSTNGMGRKVLKPNLSFESQVTEPNTIYVIQYDFTLASDVTIPANCVLKFEGGSISGEHALTGNNTQINAADVAIFTAVVCTGTWNCPRITSKWFSDATSTDRIKEVFKLQNENLYNIIEVTPGNYPITLLEDKEVGISITSNTKFILNGNITLVPGSNPRCTALGINSDVTVSQDKTSYVVNKYTKNVTIEGSGSIVGDYLEHSGATGEWAHGLTILCAKDCIIRGITFTNWWGDGLICEGGENCTIENVICNGNRRNGITVTWAKNLTILGCELYNNLGISPYGGIVVEPDLEFQQSDNILIKNNIIKEQYTGIHIVSYHGMIRNVIVENNNISILSDNASHRGIGVRGYSFDSYYNENIVIRDNVVKGYVRSFYVDFTKDIIIENNKFLSENTVVPELAINETILWYAPYISNSVNICFRNNYYINNLGINFGYWEKRDSNNVVISSYYQSKHIILENNYINTIDVTTIKHAISIYLSSFSIIKNNNILGCIRSEEGTESIEVINNNISVKNTTQSAAIYLKSNNNIINNNIVENNTLNQYTSCMRIFGTSFKISTNKCITTSTPSANTHYIVLEATAKFGEVKYNTLNPSLPTSIVNNGDSTSIDVDKNYNVSS